MATVMFAPEWRQDFQSWLQRNHKLRDKSAREYFYQLGDVCREVFKEKGMEGPSEAMDKAAIKAFLEDNAERLADIVLQRKKKKKKLPVLAHLKEYLQIKTLELPGRSDRSIIHPELRREFVRWLSEVRHVMEGKNALAHYYGLVELLSDLLKRLGRSIDPKEVQLKHADVKQLIEGNLDEVTALIQERHEVKKKSKTMAFLNHVKQFFALHSLVLPNWSDRSLINPKLKREFFRWLQDERCLTDKTMKQYYREVSRIIRQVYLNNRELGGTPEGGLTKPVLLDILKNHQDKVRAVEGTLKSSRGWNVFKTFLGLQELDDVRRPPAQKAFPPESMAAMKACQGIMTALFQEEFVAWLFRHKSSAKFRKKCLDVVNKMLTRIMKKVIAAQRPTDMQEQEQGLPTGIQQQSHPMLMMQQQQQPPMPGPQDQQQALMPLQMTMQPMGVGFEQPPPDVGQMHHLGLPAGPLTIPEQHGLPGHHQPLPPPPPPVPLLDASLMTTCATACQPGQNLRYSTANRTLDKGACVALLQDHGQVVQEVRLAYPAGNKAWLTFTDFLQGPGPFMDASVGGMGLGPSMDGVGNGDTMDYYDDDDDDEEEEDEDEEGDEDEEMVDGLRLSKRRGDGEGRGGAGRGKKRRRREAGHEFFEVDEEEEEEQHHDGQVQAQGRGAGGYHGGHMMASAPEQQHHQQQLYPPQMQLQQQPQQELQPQPLPLLPPPPPPPPLIQEHHEQTHQQVQMQPPPEPQPQPQQPDWQHQHQHHQNQHQHQHMNFPPLGPAEPPPVMPMPMGGILNTGAGMAHYQDGTMSYDDLRRMLENVLDELRIVKAQNEELGMSEAKGAQSWGDIEEMSSVFDFLEGDQPFMEDLCMLNYQDTDQPQEHGARGSGPVSHVAKRTSGSQKRRLNDSSDLYNCSSLPNACLPVLPSPPSQPSFIPPPPPAPAPAPSMPLRPSDSMVSPHSHSQSHSHTSSSARSSASRDHPLDRKKHRERMRRMEVNDGFNQLLAALDEVDADSAAKANSVSMNKGEFRVDILSRAAKTLRKLHHEVESCRAQLEQLKVSGHSQVAVPMQTAGPLAVAPPPIPAVAPPASNTCDPNNSNKPQQQQPQQPQQPTLPMTWVTVPMWLPSMDNHSAGAGGSTGGTKQPQALAPAPAPMMLMPGGMMPSTFFSPLTPQNFGAYAPAPAPSTTPTSTTTSTTSNSTTAGGGGGNNGSGASTASATSNATSGGNTTEASDEGSKGDFAA